MLDIIRISGYDKRNVNETGFCEMEKEACR